MKISRGFILLIVSVVVCSSCKKSVGRFVYQDDEGAYHVDESCSNIKSRENRQRRSAHVLHPIDTMDFVFDCEERICSSCVSVENYVHLKSISNRNREIKVESYRESIYSALVTSGYQMESYEDFVENISDPIRRKKLYETTRKEDLIDFFVRYDEFSWDLGFE